MAVTSANALDLANMAFSRVENMQVNAELMISAAAIIQLDPDRSVTIDCAPGSLTISHQDNDLSATLTEGDRVVLGLTNCANINGTLTLSVSFIVQTGSLFDALTGRIAQDFRVSSGTLTLAVTSDQPISFSVSASELRFSTTNAQLATSAAGVTFGISTTSITKTLVASNGSYIVDFSGTGNFNGPTFQFLTTASFNGLDGQFPASGVAEIRGNLSAARILSSDDLGLHPLSARLQLDTDGNGLFDPATLLPWDELIVGDLFGMGDSSQPPLTTSIRGRSKSLGGIAHDAIVDDARNRIYVSLTDRNEVAVLDQDSLLVVDRIFIGARPMGIWLSSSGGELYAALGSSGSLGVLDLEDRSLEVISATTALGTPFAYDVMEAAPGVVFLAGNPGSVNNGYLARIDRTSGNAVTRVAGDRQVRVQPGMEISADKRTLYVGAGSVLYKVDASSAAAPVLLEQSTGAGGQMALRPDGSRFYTPLGRVLNTSNFAEVGTITAGKPYATANGANVFVADWPHTLSIHSASSLALVDEFATDCPATRPVLRLIPFGDDGQWLMVSEAGICAIDIFDPLNPPGTAGVDLPPREPATIEVSGLRINLSSFASDIIYDNLRSRVHVAVQPDRKIVSYDATTLDELATYTLSGEPMGLALSPSGQELAVAMTRSVPLAFVDLNSGTIQTLNISATLGSSDAFAVEYTSDDSIFVHGGNRLVRTNRAGTTVVRVANQAAMTDSVNLAADPSASRLHVVDYRSPAIVRTLDTAQADAPVLTQGSFSSQPGRRGLSLSPDRSSLAFGNGLIFRVSDLTQSASTGVEGVAIFSADGTRLVVGRNDGEMHVYDSLSYVPSMIVATDCGGYAAHIVQLGASDNWVHSVGLTLCRFTMPSSNGFSGKPAQTKLLPPPYFCDDDCMMRRHVLPIIDELQSAHYRGFVQ